MSVQQEQRRHLIAFVAGVVLVSSGAMLLAWQVRSPFPGYLAILSTCILSFLLDRSPMMYRVGARGSTAFVVHLASHCPFRCLLGRPCHRHVYGSERCDAGGINSRRPRSTLRSGFFAWWPARCSIRLCLVGRSLPLFWSRVIVPAAAVQRDFFLFFALVGTYVVLNKLLVAGVVSLSEDRPFREVWHLNSRGIIGYDLGCRCSRRDDGMVLCEG